MRPITRYLFSVPAAALLMAPVMAALQTPGVVAVPALAQQFDIVKLMGQAPTYDSPTRLERTPHMDGLFRRDEWDVLWMDRQLLNPPPPVPVTPVKTETAPPESTSPVNPLVPPATSDPKNTVPPPPQKPAEQPQVVQPPVQQAPPQVIDKGTYMNWEPGKLYFAASMPAGNDLVISIDGQGKGFGKGEDNLELRLSPGPAGAPVHVSARMLFADGGASSAWHDAPGFVLSTQAVSGVLPDGNVFIEATVIDPGINLFSAQLHSQFGVRADIIPAATPPIDASVARATTLVFLDDVRSTDLPDNLNASVGEKGRRVVPGDSMSLRFEFMQSSTENHVKSVDISGEGPLDDLVNSLRVPDPSFDAKGHSSIDFPTRMSPKAPFGYGVIQAVLKGDGWGPAKVEASVRVEPPVELAATPLSVKSVDRNGRINGTSYVLTNIDTRQEGTFQVVPPAGWQVVDGSNKTFLLYGKGAKATRGFVLEPPRGTRGTFMATLRVTFLGSTIETPYFITIL